MQLVLSNNRVIAHGENFLSMGGVVINAVTGAKYDNATVAECECCPSDINEVGYEYKGGVFVPCAPYGKGNNNGYFMEVCENCATPRNSGIPISAIKFVKLGSIAINSGTHGSNGETIEVPIPNETILKYDSLRYVIKEGSSIDFSNVSGDASVTIHLLLGNTYQSGIEIFTLVASGNGGILTISEDIEIKNSFPVGKVESKFSINGGGVSCTDSGRAIITHGSSSVVADTLYLYIPSSYNISVNLNLEIRGREVL